jgi:hypothetical protein
MWFLLLEYVKMASQTESIGGDVDDAMRVFSCGNFPQLTVGTSQQICWGVLTEVMIKDHLCDCLCLVQSFSHLGET